MGMCLILISQIKENTSSYLKLVITLQVVYVATRTCILV